MLGDSMRRRRGEPKRSEEEPGPDRSGRPAWPAWVDRDWRSWLRPFSWGRWLVIAAVVLLGSFGVGYLLSTLVLFPPPETAGAGVPVPDLYGQGRSQAEATLRTLELELGEVRELKSMTTEAGRVLAQDPIPGQQLLPGATVSLGVSAGPPELRVPPLVGLGQATARELLESVGFDVVVQQVRSAEFEAGIVTRTEPPAGTARPLPTVVTLVVSSGPPADTIGDTEGDTVPGQAPEPEAGAGADVGSEAGSAEPGR